MIGQINAVNIRELVFSYNDNYPFFRNLSLSIEKGSIFYLSGPEGSGKTTLIKILSGLLNQYKGTVEVLGADMHGNAKNISDKIWYTLNSPDFFNSLPADENLRIACSDKNPGKEKIRAAMDMAKLNLNGSKYKTFSKVNKQKLALAASYLSGAELIMIDEPFDGLNFSGITELRKIIADINKEKRASFFITGSEPEEAGPGCTDYGIINNGILLETGKRRSG